MGLWMNQSVRREINGVDYVEGKTAHKAMLDHKVDFDELRALCCEAEPFEAYLPQFYPGRGTITFLGITQDGDGYFKFVVAEGENVDGPIFTFGDTNMRMKFSDGARQVRDCRGVLRAHEELRSDCVGAPRPVRGRSGFRHDLWPRAHHREGGGDLPRGPCG